MRYFYDLSGTWQFRLDNEKQGLKEHFETGRFSDTITLPGTTAEQKKGEPNHARETGFLTEEYKTEGYAWFQRQISVAKEAVGQHAVLSLERTRISCVWVDGVYAGTQNSLCTSHTYDLTGYIKNDNPVITIMISNTDYPTKGGHMTSPDTQTNWNGILGRMSLSFYKTARMTAIRTDVDYDSRMLDASISVENYDAMWKGVLRVYATPVTLETYGKTDLPQVLLWEKEVGVNAADCDNSNAKAGAGAPPQNSVFTFRAKLPETLPDWDEYAPAVIRLWAELTISGTDPEQQQLETWFGIRKFEARNTHFYINGRKTFLRGKHDGMIFPLTGYAPMNVEGWLTHMKAAKALGINHYRCHTCCPPEAAFLAADLLGIYYEPELPFWGTFAGKNDEGYDEISQEYLTEEGFRICKEFGNHPSFCMMSMGNELWGNPEALNNLLGHYKEYDSRHLYTQGSNNFQWVPNIQPNDDFFCGVRFSKDRLIRGSYAMCDAPQGHVQTDRPCTDFNYDDAVSPMGNKDTGEPSTDGVKDAGESAMTDSAADGTVEIQYGTGVKRVRLTDPSVGLIPRVPVVSHEIGQYETYPDFDEIKKYRGVLKARNFEIFRERLEEKGLLNMAKDYFKSSGALAVACYKDELETALRTKDMAGFQILDIQDFSGQGTALVGVLDAFMENKGLVSPEEFREFCSDAVIQAEFPTYILQNGGQFEADISLAWYRKELPSDTTVIISFAGEEYTLPFADPFRENGYRRLGRFTAKIPSGDTPKELALTVSLAGTDVRNHYTLWSYPPAPEPCATGTEKNTADRGTCGACPSLITSDPKEALQQAKAGTPVLLCPSREQNPNTVEGTYCTDFWCYPMFRGISESMGKPVPVGTMGLLIRSDHPALSLFPSRSYSTPQWWDIVMRSASTVLDQTDIVPIVQTIDNFERNHRLGLLYEIKIKDSETPILVCTSPLPLLAKEGHAEAGWLLKSLCEYVANRPARPADNARPLSGQEFLNLFTVS